MNKPTDVYLIQNPFLGALSIWQFVVGYCSIEERGTPLKILYIVFPLVADEKIRYLIRHSKKGLYSFKRNVSKNNKVSELLRINNIIPLMYDLSSEAICLAIASDLIKPSENRNLSFVHKIKSLPNKLSSSEKEYAQAANKLGSWMAVLNNREISQMIGIEF